MATQRLLLVADVTYDPATGETAESVLDAFREAVLPGLNYGVVLTQATPDTVRGFHLTGPSHAFVWADPDTTEE